MRNAILALVALAVTTASAPSQAWAEKMIEGPNKTAPLSHDFGVQPRGKELKVDFKIKNPYAVRMEITSIKPGCGCVTATVGKRILEAREETVLNLVMDTKRFQGAKTVGVRVTVGPE